MVEPGSRPAEAAGLRIDAVEVLPTDLRSVLLRVAGAWEGPPPERLAAPGLVLREPDRRHRVDALPETAGRGPPDAARRAPPGGAARAVARGRRGGAREPGLSRRVLGTRRARVAPGRARRA